MPTCYGPILIWPHNTDRYKYVGKSSKLIFASSVRSKFNNIEKNGMIKKLKPNKIPSFKMRSLLLIIPFV